MISLASSPQPELVEIDNTGGFDLQEEEYFEDDGLM